MDYRFPLFKEDKMLLPALMDMFKTNKLKSLLMGAGNADNTPAASAMADHVLFCWKTTYVSDVCKRKVAEGGVWNGRVTDHAKSSLLVYVDRAAATCKLLGKVLYCFPVFESGKLRLPRTKLELSKYLISPTMLSGADKREIDRITRMQGVK